MKEGSHSLPEPLGAVLVWNLLPVHLVYLVDQRIDMGEEEDGKEMLQL